MHARLANYSGTSELIFIDSRERDDCYGRYANDPLDDLLVNAKAYTILVIFKFNQKKLLRYIYSI